MNVFLSCVKSKSTAAGVMPARERYTSTLFTSSYRYAQSLHPDHIYILSAKFGLIKPSTPIPFYSLTLNDATKEQRLLWTKKVIEQCHRAGVDLSERAVFLCGLNYREFLMPYFDDASCPVEGLGLGRQLSFYKRASS